MITVCVACYILFLPECIDDNNDDDDNDGVDDLADCASFSPGVSQAPEAITSGNTPTTKARAVIITGRSLNSAPLRTASFTDKVLANLD